MAPEKKRPLSAPLSLNLSHNGSGMALIGVRGALGPFSTCQSLFEISD